MKRLFLPTAVLALLIASSLVLRTEAVGRPALCKPALCRPARPPAGQRSPHQAMLTTYCYSCHNTRVKMGGLALQGLDIQAAGADAEAWEKAVRKLRGRLMPPPGSPQPEQKDIDAFVAWMENTLDTNPRAPKAGYVGLQRLSRIEYAAAVKALVGVEIVAKDVLPQDAAVEGFDNIASALNVSPTFMEQYVEAARTIAKKAIGDRSLDSTSYAAAAHRGVEAMPLGLRDGGMRLKHNFPVDGEYRFNILFPDGTLGLYTGSLENEATLVLMIDGKVMFKKPIGGLNDLMLNNRKAGDGRQQIVDRFRNVSLPIQAGVREVVVGFIDRSRFESLGNQGGGGGGLPSFNSIEIKGPYNPTGAVSTEGRKLLYVCDPKVAGEAPCAKQIADDPGAARVPPPRCRGGPRPIDAVLRGRAQGGRLRSRHRTSGGGGAGQSRFPVSRDSRRSAPRLGSGRPQGGASMPSPITSWRRVCRSSSGTPGPTRSCSSWRRLVS